MSVQLRGRQNQTKCLKMWRRGWDSHPHLALETRKLFILRNARNAKNAQRPPFGYAVVTWVGAKSQAGSESLESPKVLHIQAPSKLKRGALNSVQKPAIPKASNGDLLKISIDGDPKGYVTVG